MYVQRSQSETALLHGERGLPCTRNRNSKLPAASCHHLQAATAARARPAHCTGGALVQAQVGHLLRLTQAGEAVSASSVRVDLRGAAVRCAAIVAQISIKTTGPSAHAHEFIARRRVGPCTYRASANHPIAARTRNNTPGGKKMRSRRKLASYSCFLGTSSLGQGSPIIALPEGPRNCPADAQLCIAPPSSPA